jgi:hypothetical protein
VTPSIASLVDNSALGGFEGADVAAPAAPAADAAPSSTDPVAATN